MKDIKWMGHGLKLEVNEKVAAITSFPGFEGATIFPLQGISGMFRLQDESGYYDGKKMKITKCEIFKNKEGFAVTFENDITRLISTYRYKDDVWSQITSLENKQNKPSTIYSAQSRFIVNGDHFDIYSQDGSWCEENQGYWRPFEGSGVHIQNMGVRTTEGAQPFFAIRETNQGYGLAFHILPMGQWEISINKRFTGYSPMTVIDMGLCDEGLHLELAPKEKIDLPEILFYPIEPNDKGIGAHIIQKYVLKNMAHAKTMPVLWNSWFYDFDRLDFSNFKKEAKAAQEIGCEYFVVDAGWFGSADSWSVSVGDWTERKKDAFKGRMNQLSKYVNELGMKFGLWLEPERVIVDTPIYEEHKDDWFIELDGCVALIDLGKEGPRQFVYDTIKRLVSTCNLEYMKLDFNMSAYHDKTGSGFYRYYQGFYKMYKKIMKDFPNVYFEFCCSGGLRTDIKAVTAADCHFLTDTVNPFEELRILEGAMTRLPSSMISKWYCCREVVGIARPEYIRHYEPVKRLVACADGLWDRIIEIHPDFAEAVALTGPLGITGKISDYSDEQKQRMIDMIKRFKSIRNFMQKAVCYLLTEPKSKFNIKDDAIWQFSDEKNTRHLIFGFHLEYQDFGVVVHPRGLDPKKTYKLTNIGSMMGFDDSNGRCKTGEELMKNGFVMTHIGFYSGRIVEIKEVKKK